MSPEEIERYIAQQDAELAGKYPARKSAPKNSLPLGSLIYAIPFLFLMGIMFCFWNMSTNTTAAKKTTTWDSILGYSAKAAGREYNANANSLTERFTFKKKKP